MLHQVLKRLRLPLVLGISFFDYLAFALIIPHNYSLILDGPYSLLGPEFSSKARVIILGFLLATYPLAKVFGNPILGAIADSISRKRVLLISFIGNFLGYALSAYAIYTQNVLYLFLGNGMAGLMGANISTTDAVIADLSEKKQKARRFSYSIMTFGSAFIIGPFISGQLFVHLQAFGQPVLLIFALSAIISLLNFSLLSLFFHDVSKGLGLPRLRFHFISREIKQVFKQTRALKTLLTGVFALYLGWNFFIKFFRVLLLDRLHYSIEAYCNILSYFGICCLITQALYSIFCHRLIEDRLLKLSAPLLALSILSLAFISSPITVITAVTLFSFCYAIMCPALTYVVSEAGHALSQGKILALFQAVQALAQVLGPALAGLSMAMHPTAPIAISCALIASSGLIFSRTAPKPASAGS